MTSPATNPDVIHFLNHIDRQKAADRGFLDQISRAPKRFYLTTFLVVIWCGIFMAAAAMLVAKLPDPVALMQHQTRLIPYVFQIPMVVLVAAMLGRKFGTLAVLLYLIAGFAGLPVFAGGGGPGYFSQPSIGYLLSFVLVPWAIHPFLCKAFRNTGWLKGRSLWLIFAAILAVLTVHLCGVLGVGIHWALGHINMIQAGQWIHQLSWPVLIYDLAFCIVAVSIVRLIRVFFWFCLY